MKQESEAKAKGETFMPDSALGMLQDYAVDRLVLTFRPDRLDRTRCLHRLCIPIYACALWIQT